ncbi:MAG: MFS transporter [Anaerolineae bacterium]
MKGKVARAPLTASARRVLWGVGLGTALSIIGDASLYIVLPTHTADAGVLIGSVGILLSANRLVRLVANSGAGWLADRWPRRRIFLPALLLGAFSTAIYALTQGFWPLLIGRLAWGIAWSGIWVVGNAIIFDIADEENRGRWVGYYQIAFFTGASSGAVLGGVLTDWLGFHGAMGVAAVLTLLGLTAAFFLLPETRPIPAIDKSRPGPEKREAPRLPPPRRLGELATANALMVANRIVFAGVLVSTFSLFLKGLLGDSLQVGGRGIGISTLTGVGLGLSTVLSMVSAPLFGGLSDRIRNRWRAAAAGLSSGVAGYGLLALGMPLAMLIGLPLTSISSGSNQGLATALVGDLTAETQRGRSLGVLYTVGDIGSALGPLLAYGLIPYWGLNGIYGMAAVLMGVMLLAAVGWGSLRPLPVSEG